MNAQKGLLSSTILDLLARTLVLTYGGVALMQWLHGSLLGGSAEGGLAGYAHLARDGSLALPWVGAALVASTLIARKQGRRRGVFAAAGLFGAIMGAGSLAHQLFPEIMGAHGGGEVSLAGVAGQTAMIFLAAGAYALLACVAWNAGAGEPAGGGRFWAPRMVPAQRLLAALVVAMPLVLLAGAGRAIAQTSFPDQVIHPRGSLTLIARRLGDGTMAYVAPEFGNNGVRPIIEMVEGETLDITLKNELTADVSLHVHGVHYNQDSDGTRHSGSFVRPGQQKVYQWRAAPGTAGYWHYHDHVMGDDEGSGGIQAGLYGGLVVRKPGDPRPAKTFLIVGHDKTLNGRIYPDTPTPTARQGELVEFLVVSHGNRVHTFHLHGHRWLDPPRTADPNPGAGANSGSGRQDNQILAPGDSFGFLAFAGEGVGPGMWMYHCHFQDHAGAMKGFFKVLPAAQANADRSRTFPETGKTVSGRFLEYWEQNGGLAQQGYPLSEPFMEKSDLDGKTYLVQYFERAVFEMHPENKKPFDVLLSQLGTFRYKEKYQGGR